MNPSEYTILLVVKEGDEPETVELIYDCWDCAAKALSVAIEAVPENATFAFTIVGVKGNESGHQQPIENWSPSKEEIH